MAVPTFEQFVEPLLRLLHDHPEGVRTADAYALLAERCHLTPADQAELLPTGRQPLFKNRIGWAQDRLKRAGLTSSPHRGHWTITEAGRAFVAKHGDKLTADLLNASLALVGGDIPDPMLTIGMLEAARRPPVSVKRDSSLREAVTLMLLRDFSQLPVMQSERAVSGYLSWKTIGRRHALEGSHEFVRDCMDTSVTIVDEERPLFDVLEIINRSDFVLVEDKQKRIIGIVTPSDVGQQFKEMSEPFLLLGIVENQVRRLIAGRFPVEVLRAMRDPDDAQREIRSVFDMTFGEYVRLLEREEQWKRLRLAIDRRTFIQALDRVRQVRNDVMHFDPDIQDDAVQELRDFVRFLREIEPSEK